MDEAPPSTSPTPPDNPAEQPKEPQADQVARTIEKRYWEIIKRSEAKRSNVTDYRTNVLRQAVFLSFPDAEDNLGVLQKALVKLKNLESFNPEIGRFDLNVDLIDAELKNRQLLFNERREWLVKLEKEPKAYESLLPPRIMVDFESGETVARPRNDEIARELKRLAAGSLPEG